MNKHKNYIYIYRSGQNQFSKKIDKELTKKRVAFGLNIAILALVVIGLGLFFGNSEPWAGRGPSDNPLVVTPRTALDLKYFTVLSNIWMGMAAIMMIVVLALNMWGKYKKIHKSIYIIDFATTTSVAITMFTTVLFLLPFAMTHLPEDPRIDQSIIASMLLGGSSMFFHILVPVVSIASYIAVFNTKDIKLVETLYALIPMFAYSIFYMCMALTHIDPDGKIIEGYDWYGFCSFGLQFIPLVLLFMYGGSFLLAWLLWLGNKKIETKKIHFEYALNITILLFAIISTWWLLIVKDTWDKLKWALMWWTDQSTWLMGIGCIVWLVFMILRDTKVIKEIPNGLYAFKLACVAGVALTLVFEFVYNIPLVEGWVALRGQNIFFHLMTPVVAILSYITVETTQKMKLRYACAAIAPFVGYLTFYWIINYVNMKPDEPWHWDGPWDWYKFMGWFKWWSIAVVIGFAAPGFLFGWTLWICNRKIHIGLPKAPSYLEILKRNKNVRK